MSIQGHGHILTLTQGHSDCFFSETTYLFITKFHRKAFRNKEMKINKYEFGLFQNQWTDCLETWYVVLWSRGPS